MLTGTARPTKNGFTILELLVVVTIMGVLVAILLPSMATAFRHRATSGAVDQMTMAHALTVATAVQFGRVAELHIDAANKRYWVEVDTSGTGIRDTVGTLRLLNDALTVTSTRSVLCFDARGLATTRGACEAGNVIVTFSTNGRSDSLVTTVLGKVIR